MTGNKDDGRRYARQAVLVGEDGQNALKRAKVFVAGAGGLGSPAATYLAAAGVGTIILLDKDTADMTNLNRQFLHHEKDIGREKAVSGAEKLAAFNPDVRIVPLTASLTAENVSELAGACDLIVDALDNNETRAILARYAVDCGIPYFHAAVFGFGGQLSSFLPGKENPCPFCLFPELADAQEQIKPADEKTPIIGAAAGAVGSMEALEVIKYLTGKNVLCGKLLIWDGLMQTADIIEYGKNGDCPVCSGKN